MYEQIIVGHDGSDEAADALALGRLIAGTTGAALVLARVFPFDPYVAEGVGSGRRPEVELLEIEMERIAADLHDVAEASGAEVSVLPCDSVVRGLHELCEERHAGLIVVGSTHRARLGTVLLGSVGQRLLEGAPCAVAVAPRGLRERQLDQPRVVGVAYDGSAESERALGAASELARSAGATIRLLAALPPADGPRGRRLASDARRARDELPSDLRAAAHILHGPAAAVIAEEAEKGVDVLFVGSRGYGPVRRVLLGSTSSQLMAHAPCPVVVTPRAGNAAGAASHAAAGREP